MSVSYTLNYTRPGKRKRREESTKVLFSTPVAGIFQSHAWFSMFDGELTVHIHASNGHFLNFVIVIVQPDEMPITIKSDEYNRETSKDTIINTICDHFKDHMRMSAKFRRNLRYWFEGDVAKIA